MKGAVKAVDGEYTQSVADQEEIKKLFPNTYGMPVITFEKSNEKKELPAMNVGVILSGGQAPGGHNVIAGLFDGIKAHNPASRLYGFILGPGGLVDHKYMELTADIIDEYRNTGGFDMIGSGRTKLEKKEQFDKGLEILKELDIKALVIIGGDDSNTNACVLAEYYKAIGAGVQVIGCPKTIDGDLKNEQIETSFGFDTACKVYSEVIGNIQRDCNSAQKYWHFIKLMGRSASHIALECALQTQPNICIISEEVEAKEMSLDDIVTYIADIVAKRAAAGNNFGTVLIPEGLIEFVPAMKRLIAELNDFLAKHDAEFKMIKKSEQRAYIISKLTKENSELYASLPEGVARQLSLDRDPHGNVQVSLIETEKLLSEMVGKKLAEWKLLLLIGLHGILLDRRWQDRLYVVRTQHDGSGRPMDRGWYPCHDDDEHGASSWRDEAGYPEGVGEVGWRSVQGVRFSPRGVGVEHMLRLSGSDPVLWPDGGLRPADQDVAVGAEEIRISLQILDF